MLANTKTLYRTAVTNYITISVVAQSLSLDNTIDVPSGADVASNVREEIEEKASAYEEKIDDIVDELESGSLTCRQASLELDIETAKIMELQLDSQEKLLVVSIL